MSDIRQEAVERAEMVTPTRSIAEAAIDASGLLEQLAAERELSDRLAASLRWHSHLRNVAVRAPRLGWDSWGYGYEASVDGVHAHALMDQRGRFYLCGNGDEPWQFEGVDEDESFRAVEAAMAKVRA